ncbi:MAG: hypothetical protein A2806_03265 [Candidatus Terrybacteria bacterium RIFCSPHIGHO2_01_FULL_48_17]|uniref:Uncharacterized protein n=1 Tax=Candidatus Terrybacteria bacterium RIFCSPHIGHO2_01_FULL_48_17 TaxID=1802362 RepID=A0A1G2PH68_9BACT|nr:MAG: hypothetical protein A2806_03265 [Candidatus Terrybacteria bacterium RIFCSPHIGHO2_01_FULL_48_17]OHA53150.1 MAG: hypothetical protein A3A30_02195 [Candidatus Terrybacteria bacterium RIFCSPLOWO2_01_FULL_48_14]
MPYHIEDGVIRVVFKRGITQAEALNTISRLGCEAKDFTSYVSMNVIVHVPQGKEADFAERFLREPNVAIAATIHKEH